jgi:hypothetical protein
MEGNAAGREPRSRSREKRGVMTAHRHRRPSPTRLKSSGLVGIAAALAFLAGLLGAAVLAAPASARAGAVPTGRAFAKHLAAVDPGGACRR